MTDLDVHMSGRQDWPCLQKFDAFCSQNLILQHARTFANLSAQRTFMVISRMIQK